MSAVIHPWQMSACAWTLQMRLWGRAVQIPEGPRSDADRANFAFYRRNLQRLSPQRPYLAPEVELLLSWEEQVVEGYITGAFALTDADVDEDAVRLIEDGNAIMQWRDLLAAVAGVRPVEEAVAELPAIPRRGGRLYLEETPTGWLVTGDFAAYHYRIKQIAHQHGGVYGRLTRSWWFRSLPDDLQALVNWTREAQ